jgi:hypothetical protein
MKIKSTVLCRIALLLPAILLFQSRLQGQTGGELRPATAAGTSAESAAQTVNYTCTFSFPGGTPRTFLQAAETMFQTVRFDNLVVPTNSNWSTGWEARVKEAEKELHTTKVDWLSIADVPRDMQLVELPKLRFNLRFYLNDGRLSWSRRRGTSGDWEGSNVPMQVQDNLKGLIALYNRVGQEKPEVGHLVVEGDLTKPSLVMLVPDKSGMATQPQVKAKAFSLLGISEKSLGTLQADIDHSQRLAAEYSDAIRAGRPLGRGFVSIHSSTHLLVATGSEAYVEMVASVLEAYRQNWPYASQVKPSNEK